MWERIGSCLPIQFTRTVLAVPGRLSPATASYHVARRPHYRHDFHQIVCFLDLPIVWTLGHYFDPDAGFVTLRLSVRFGRAQHAGGRCGRRGTNALREPQHFGK